MGEFYRGGMFIPASVLRACDRGQKAKLSEGSGRHPVVKPVLARPTDQQVYDIIDRDTWIDEEVDAGTASAKAKRMLEFSGGGSFETAADKIIETMRSNPPALGPDRRAQVARRGRWVLGIAPRRRHHIRGWHRPPCGEIRPGPGRAHRRRAALIGSIAGGTALGGGVTAAIGTLFIASPYVVVFPSTARGGRQRDHVRSGMGGAYAGGALAAARSSVSARLTSS